jgi:hypothetical protein
MDMFLRIILACTFAVLVSAVPVAAQPIPTGCGAIATSNQAFQDGAYALRVRGLVKTSRDLTPCPLTLQSEGWVSGAGGAHVGTGTYSANTDFSVPVSQYQMHQVEGKHWAIVSGAQWHSFGHTVSQVLLLAPGQPPPDDDLPCDTDPAWPGCNSPIIADIANNGYQLTSVADGVQFDINADGHTEQVAWTQANSDDAFLAMDRNGNGQIDNGSELFGNYTPTVPASSADPIRRAANGFEALKYAQRPAYGPSVLDDQIDGQDAPFAALVFWRDGNHNGISEADELTPVAVAGLVSISTDYKESRRVDRHGNEFRLRARSTWGNGVRQPIFDVWLRTEYAPATTNP